jgi:phenylalanyl-tRNA synthetase beta chain
MKISLEWLNDYIETGLSAEQIAAILSDMGFPCEGIEHLAADAVIDVEVTSNRGDCLGYIGVARELAVATGKQLKIPEVDINESEKAVSEFASVEIQEPSLCGRYTARVIEGVKIAPSPNWLIRRLEAVGMRSVNNVVDATNYAMMETGQPPHAFDYAKIKQGKIIVRKARPGERLVSIDGSQCELTADMLIIADPNGPAAIAGVMGGLNTEVSADTTTILLEDAFFDPVCVRTTTRRLSLPSEASYRFERIVDMEMIDWVSKRTAQLITKLAGGKIARGVVDIYPQRKTQKLVTLRISRMSKLLGIDIPVQDTLRILSALGFKPQLQDELINCIVPTWRSDVYREVDLIEEVARVYGYAKIPTERKISIEAVPVNARGKLLNSIGTYLNGCGFYETINVSFTDSSTSELFTGVGTEGHLTVKDESRKNANLLRRSLLGSLLGVMQTNLNAKTTPCKVFEIAQTYEPITGTENILPKEKTRLALCCDGQFRELKGAIEGLLSTITHNTQIEFQPLQLSWASTGSQILLAGEPIGVAGIVNDAVRKKFSIKNISPCAAELDLEPLETLSRNSLQIKPIPRFPAIQRDLSIIVNESVRWADILKAIKAKASDELQQVDFVEIYKGKGVPEGKKSLTLSLQFRDEDGTLTHDVADSFQGEIVRSLTESIGAVLRDS